MNVKGSAHQAKNSHVSGEVISTFGKPLIKLRNERISERMLKNPNGTTVRVFSLIIISCEYRDQVYITATHASVDNSRAHRSANLSNSGNNIAYYLTVNDPKLVEISSQ